MAAHPDTYATSENTTLTVDAAHGVLVNDVSSPGEIAPASTPASKYFLAIEGLDGGSTDAHHVGWFALGHQNRR
jgi:hypothetical protein